MELEKPRIARLTAIVTQLQSKKLLTAKEIADRHQISIRTVYRDIRTLENSGVPIITEEGKGYTLMQGYTLPPIMLSEREANALITAEQLINKNKDQSLVDEYRSAIEKIKSVMRYSQKEKAELLSDRIQIRNNPDNDKTSSYLIELQEAITNCNVVDMEYHSLEEAKSKRHIEPFALYSTQDNWIVIGWCRVRVAFRAFRLDRITKMHVTDQRFAPHQMTLEQYFEICKKNRQDP